MGKNQFGRLIKFTKAELNKYVNDENSCVIQKNRIEVISLLPACLEDIREGIRSNLSDKIGKYDRYVDGIVLDFKDTKILSDICAIRADSPYLHTKISTNYYVFQPKAGIIVQGIVKYSSAHNLNAIIYRVFNVTIKLKSQRIIPPGKEIKLLVKCFDLKSAIPYIEGELVDDLHDSEDSGIGEFKKPLLLKGKIEAKQSSSDSDSNSETEELPRPSQIKVENNSHLYEKLPMPFDDSDSEIDEFPKPSQIKVEKRSESSSSEAGGSKRRRETSSESEGQSPKRKKMRIGRVVVKEERSENVKPSNTKKSNDINEEFNIEDFLRLEAASFEPVKNEKKQKTKKIKKEPKNSVSDIEEYLSKVGSEFEPQSELEENAIGKTKSKKPTTIKKETQSKEHKFQVELESEASKNKKKKTAQNSSSQSQSESEDSMKITKKPNKVKNLNVKSKNDNFKAPIISEKGSITEKSPVKSKKSSTNKTITYDEFESQSEMDTSNIDAIIANFGSHSELEDVNNSKLKKKKNEKSEKIVKIEAETTKELMNDDKIIKSQKEVDVILAKIESEFESKSELDELISPQKTTAKTNRDITVSKNVKNISKKNTKTSKKLENIESPKKFQIKLESDKNNDKTTKKSKKKTNDLDSQSDVEAVLAKLQSEFKFQSESEVASSSKKDETKTKLKDVTDKTPTNLEITKKSKKSKPKVEELDAILAKIESEFESQSKEGTPSPQKVRKETKLDNDSKKKTEKRSKKSMQKTSDSDSQNELASILTKIESEVESQSESEVSKKVKNSDNNSKNKTEKRSKKSKQKPSDLESQSDLEEIFSKIVSELESQGELEDKNSSKMANKKTSKKQSTKNPELLDIAAILAQAEAAFENPVEEEKPNEKTKNLKASANGEKRRSILKGHPTPDRRKSVRFDDSIPESDFNTSNILSSTQIAKPQKIRKQKSI